MNQKNNNLKIAAVGDIHFHEGNEEEIKSLVEKLEYAADIVLLCGDLTDSGTEEEAEALGKILNQATKPVLAVLGNHDHAQDKHLEIKKILKLFKVHFLEDAPFEFRDYGFVGVKGFGGGFNEHMIVPFGEAANRKFVEESINESLLLERFLQSMSSKNIFVALHYSPILETVLGEPESIMPLLGNSRLAETIDRFKVQAIFHGHAHHGSLTGKTPKGIPVFNCSMPLLRKKANQNFVTFEK